MVAGHCRRPTKTHLFDNILNTSDSQDTNELCNINYAFTPPEDSLEHNLKSKKYDSRTTSGTLIYRQSRSASSESSVTLQGETSTSHKLRSVVLPVDSNLPKKQTISSDKTTSRQHSIPSGDNISKTHKDAVVLGHGQSSHKQPIPVISSNIGSPKKQSVTLSSKDVPGKDKTSELRRAIANSYKNKSSGKNSYQHKNDPLLQKTEIQMVIVNGQPETCGKPRTSLDSALLDKNNSQRVQDKKSREPMVEEDNSAKLSTSRPDQVTAIESEKQAECENKQSQGKKVEVRK